MECRKAGEVGGCRLLMHQTTLLNGCLKLQIGNIHVKIAVSEFEKTLNVMYV